MTPQVIVRCRDRPAAPWANGLGRTTELIGWADGGALSGAGGPEWRLSIARLDGPAPFSPLPGVDRHFLPVGSDVVLRIADADVGVAAGQVCRFGGDDAVALVALEPAPAQAVNLMGRASGGGPTLAVTDSRDPRCAAAIAAVALLPGLGFARLDVLHRISAADSPRPRSLALVLPEPTVRASVR